MPILSLYVGKEILKATALATIGLLSLIVFIIFIDEMGRTGRGQYDALEATLYVLATIPRHIYHIFPPAVLIGTMVGMGVLATHSELVAIRAAGVSRLQIIRIVLSSAAVLMLISIVLGEVIAPPLDSYAETRRSLVMNDGKALKTSKGIWVRDANNFIRVNTVLAGGNLQGLQVFEMTDSGNLERFLYAEKARHQGDGQWELKKVRVLRMQSDVLSDEQFDRMQWHSGLEPDLMRVVVVKPDVMTVLDLFYYSNYLEANGVDARKYWLSFWSKIATPLATIIMAMLAIPFVIAYSRNVSTGLRVLVGTVIGVVFYILNQFAGYAGLVFDVTPFVAAFFPSLLFLGITVLLFRRVQ